MSRAGPRMSPVTAGLINGSSSGREVERVSESDRLLIARMEAEVLAAGRVQAFVTNHLSATYHLQPGDAITDEGVIARAPRGGPA